MSEPTILRLIDKLKTYPRILLRKSGAVITHLFRLLIYTIYILKFNIESYNSNSTVIRK